MEKHALILATTRDFLWRFERNNVKILQQLGYTVHYAANMREPFYFTAEETERELGIIPHHLDAARSPFLIHDNLRALQQLMELLRQIPFQMIHCHTPVGGVLGRLAGRLCRKGRPVILYTAHGFHFYRGAPLLNRTLYYLVEKILAHDTDILIVINREDEESALRLQLRKGGRVYRIPGTGLDRQRFRPLSPGEKAELREALGIEKEQFFLLSVGELNGNKNHGLVLEALAQLHREEGGAFHIRYGICGDGFLRSALERQIRELKLENTVTLYGYRTDIPQLLGCADASVFPSRREGLGMSGLESLAVGTPVLAADNRGTREYMIHGKNGLIFDPGKPEQLLEQIHTIRALPPERRRQMARVCRESTEPFDLKYADAIMKEVYQDAQRRIRERKNGQKIQNQHHYGRSQS